MKKTSYAIVFFTIAVIFLVMFLMGNNTYDIATLLNSVIFFVLVIIPLLLPLGIIGVLLYMARPQGRERYDRNRFSSLIATKLLLIRNMNNYELRNDNVIISYDFERGVLKVYDRKVKGRYSVVDWSKEIKSYYTREELQLRETFYFLCETFHTSTEYYETTKYLSKYYDPVETLPKIKVKPKKTYTPTKIIEINTATEQDISTLPGINLITAKKVIRYRDLHGGFQTKKEFYAVAKIKDRYLDKIDSQIMLLEPNINILMPYDNVKKEIDGEERIIDI